MCGGYELQRFALWRRRREVLGVVVFYGDQLPGSNQGCRIDAESDLLSAPNASRHRRPKTTNRADLLFIMLLFIMFQTGISNLASGQPPAWVLFRCFILGRLVGKSFFQSALSFSLAEDQNHLEKFTPTTPACAQLLVNQSLRFSTEFLPPTGARLPSKESSTHGIICIR